MSEHAVQILRDSVDSDKSSRSKLARYLDVSHTMIHNWYKGTHKLTNQKVIDKLIDSNFSENFMEFCASKESVILGTPNSVLLSELNRSELEHVLRAEVDRGDWCFPQAAILFAGGGQILVLRENAKEGRKEEIETLLSSAPFRDQMSHLLEITRKNQLLNLKTGNISSFAFEYEELTVIMRVFGRWIDPVNAEVRGQYFFDETIIAIVNTDDYRPAVVKQRMTEMIDKLRRKRGAAARR